MKPSISYCNHEIVSSLECIHFGSSLFQDKKFNQIENYPFNHPKGTVKPKGGLWASPQESAETWLEFFSRSRRMAEKCVNSFKFSFKLNSRVIVIDNLDDLAAFPFRKDLVSVNWEQVCRLGDAVWLTEQGCDITTVSPTIHLCGWDIESILILNPNCINNHT